MARLTCPIGIGAVTQDKVAHATIAISALLRRSDRKARARPAKLPNGHLRKGSHGGKPDEYLLELDGLTKSFPGVLANDRRLVPCRAWRDPRPVGGKRRRQVDAGQDDLWRAAGPDSGVMHLHGETYAPEQVLRKRGLHGIGMVFQHFSLFEALSVEPKTSNSG